MAFWDEFGGLAWALSPVALLVAACFFRRGRRIVAWLVKAVAWTVVAAVLLVAGMRLAREAANIVHGRGLGRLERAGWRGVVDECRVWEEGWSRTYEVGAEGMSRGWVGLAVWESDWGAAPYRGKLRLEWVDGAGRTVRESVAGAEGPEGLAFSAPAGDGPGGRWTLPLERLDTAWVAAREAADGLRLRVTVVEPDDRYLGEKKNMQQVTDFCIWLEK